MCELLPLAQIAWSLAISQYLGLGLGLQAKHRINVHTQINTITVQTIQNTPNTNTHIKTPTHTNIHTLQNKTTTVQNMQQMK